MTEQDVIYCLKSAIGEEMCEECSHYGFCDHTMQNDINRIAISDIEEIEQYRALGTVEQLSNSVKEEDILKFYYCESEDDYYIGKRIDTMYYAKYEKTGFVWFMSRYLLWEKHIVDENTLWKEYTYPSEPKEIPFFEWLTGFLKKYCGGTVEELREATEKQRVEEPYVWADGYSDGQLVYDSWDCPNCGKSYEIDYEEYKYCPNCGQAIDWSKKE